MQKTLNASWYRQVRTTDSNVTGEIEGYIAIWGDETTVDAYGTWFDKEQPPELGLDFLPFPLMYEHGQDVEVRIDPVGKVFWVGFDAVGIRFKARLNKASKHFVRILSEVTRGILATSSGSAEHLVEFDSIGRFVKWFLSELSLTAFPAEERMPAVALVRSAAGKLLTFTSGSRDASAEGQSERLLRRKIMKTKFRSQSGKILTVAQVRARIIAGRMLYDESGEEVDAATALAELVASGESADSLMAMLQEMAAPEDDERSLDEDDEDDFDDEEDFDDEDDDDVDERDVILQGLIAMLQGEGRSKRSTSRSRGKGKSPRRQSAWEAKMRKMQQKVDAMESLLREQESADTDDETKPARGLKGKKPMIVIDKFATMSAAEMAMGYMLMRATRKHAELPVSEGYLKAMTMKAAADMESGDKVAKSLATRSHFPKHNGRPIRADEVMQTDLTGFGEEWVYDLQGTQLWENIRNETPLLQALLGKGLVEREIPNGFRGETIQIEGDDPQWYVAPETSDEDADSGRYNPTFNSSRLGTKNKTMTVAKLSVALVYSEELNEDSIINMASEAQRKIQVTAAEQIETILLNGDTALGANTNINTGDGTPAAAPARSSYTLFDGIIKKWLDTAYDLDGGAAISEALFLQLLKLLPSAVRANRSRLLYILDSDTYLSALTMPKVQSIETHMAKTVESGDLPHIWGVDIFQSGFQQLATADGKISTAAPATNTLGRVSLVRPDRMHLRWKRRMRTSTEYIARYDVNEIIGHMRVGFAFQDDDGAVGAYNVKAALT